MRIFSLMFFSGVAIVAVGAVSGLAQSSNSSQGQDTISIPAWADGMTPLKRVGGIGSYTHSPYSATTVETWTEETGTGSVAHTKEGLIYRDSEGRTRAETTKHTRIMTIRDRDGKMSTVDISRMYSDEHFVSVANPVEGMGFYWTVQDEPAKRKVTVDRWPPRPPTNSSRPPEPYVPDTIEVLQSADNHIARLGGMIVNGVYADGYRETTLVSRQGAGTLDTYTLEEWLSPEFKICVRRIDIDPRRSKDRHITDTTIVSGRNPDPELFKLPQGYEVVEFPSPKRAQPANGATAPANPR